MSWFTSILSGGVDKLGVVVAGCIALGGTIGCWFKYPKFMWRKV